jgi:hypothetical protein
MMRLEQKSKVGADGLKSPRSRSVVRVRVLRCWSRDRCALCVDDNPWMPKSRRNTATTWRCVLRGCSRSSVNGRRGDALKEHQQAEDLLSSPFIRSSRSLAKEVGGSARVCASQGGRAHGRVEGGNGVSGQEDHDSDGSSHEDGDPTKEMTDLAGKVATTVNPARKATTTTDPTKATMKRKGDRASIVGQGPALDSTKQGAMAPMTGKA